MMQSAVCGRCDATGQSGNFCTVCGYDLRPPDPVVVTPRHRVAPDPPGLVACEGCGAPNADSRRVCARCRRPLGPQAEPVPAAPLPAPGRMEDFGPAVRAAAPGGRSPRLLLLAVALTAIAVLGVTGTLLAARGIGPFSPDERPSASGQTALTVSSVRASSARDGEAAERLVDGDPGTAWAAAAAGPGVGEWVELRLERRARVRRLTVWNGDQREGRFLTRNRVHELRIDLAGERFTVELLDTQGAQVVELPRAVDADRLRLTVLSVHGAAPEADTALSEVELYGTGAG